MENIYKPRGALKSQKPDSGGAVLRQLPMMGIVKDNVDTIRSGRIRVYISALGANDPDDEKNWTPLLYMSPFFGRTDAIDGSDNYGSFKGNPASYGMWNSPPDIGTLVICMFINGDPNFGFYLGSIPEAEAMRMIPAIGANLPNEDVIFNESEADKYGGVTRVPVTNMNTNNSDEADNSRFLSAPKPVHSFQAGIMFQQGVLRDTIRGPISSSSQRESPSRVGWGVSTPGRPIYEGGYTDENIIDVVTQRTTGLRVVSRRGGHSIVMDDGDLIGKDNLVRIRTSLGHQILMSDDGQTLLILHSNGQSYVELGKEGTVDVYSTNSVNVRTHGDLNLHADNNININAKKQLNILADEININSDNKTNLRVGSDYKISTQGIFTHKVGGPMSLSSAGEASFAGGGTTYINGSIINLNTGSSSTVPQEVPSIPTIAQTDTLFSKEKGWAAAPAKLITIASRAPAHMPWANAGQGVDVKVNLTADAQFPSTPSPQVATTNTAASTTATPTVVTPEAAATVPPVAAATPAVDKNTSATLVGQVATQAATASSSAAAAVAAGAGVITDAANKVTDISVGVTGLSPENLSVAGVLKPGADKLATALAQAGKSVTEAMPKNLFSTNTDLTKFVGDAQAQAGAVVSNMQNAVSKLTSSGVITGKEAPSGIAGLIVSTVKNGISATTDVLKNIGSAATQAIKGIQGTVGKVMYSISSGNLASDLSQKLTSGLSGITGAVSSLTKKAGGLLTNAKGVAAGAFEAVTNSFKSFKANIPQNLNAIAEQNKKEITSDNVDPYEDLTLDQITKLGDADPTDPFIRSRLGLPKLSNALTASTSAATEASGIANLPGGIKTVGSLVDNTKDAVNKLPGSAAVKSLMDNASTAVSNGISIDSISGAVKTAKQIGGTIQSGIGAATNTSNQIGNTLQSGIGAVTNIANQISGTMQAGIGSATNTASQVLDKLKSGAATLVSLASSVLPAKLAAQLNTAIASLSSGSSVTVKMPTLAINTNDRSSLTAAITSLLPKGVPTPNFNAPSATSVSAEQTLRDQINAQNKQLADLENESNKLNIEFDKTIATIAELKQFLPPGDPTIEQYNEELKVILNKIKNINAQKDIITAALV